jgi:hypothetical protein
MIYTAPELVLVIGAIAAGVVAIITALRVKRNGKG